MKKFIFKVLCFSAMMLIPSCANAQSNNNVDVLIENVIGKVLPYEFETILTGANELAKIANNNPDNWLGSYYSALYSLNYVSQNPKSKENEELLKNADKAIHKMETLKDADRSEVYALKGYYYLSLACYQGDINTCMPNVYNNLMKSIIQNVDNPRPRILAILFNEVIARQNKSQYVLDANEVKSINALFNKNVKNGLEPNWGKELLPKQ